MHSRSERLARVHYTKKKLVVGRSRGCDLRLPYPWISLQHCEIECTEDGVRARDLYAKRPAMIGHQALNTKWTIATPQLVLSLPGISLECESVNLDQGMEEALEGERLTLRLWREESGWILWSPDYHKGKVASRDLHSNVMVDYHSIPWEYNRGRFQQERSDRSDNLHTRTGACWLLGSEGQYLFDLNRERVALTCQMDEVYFESMRGRGVVRKPGWIRLGSTSIYLSRESHAPLV